MNKIITNTKILIALFLVLSACSTDDLEPTLAQDKSIESSITKIANIESILRGTHDRLTGSGYYGRDLIANNEVRSDNCFSNGNSGRFSTQAEYKYNKNTDYIWNNAYQVIANCNIIINIDLTTLEGDQEKGMHIQGQALILRALAHYDLLRVFGQQHASGTLGVPYVTTFKGTELFPKRNTITEVKTSIYSDLEKAYSMMDSKFDSSSSKTVVSKNVAKALEARASIYFGDWARARDAAKNIIDNGNYTIADANSYVSNWATASAPNSIFELGYAGDDNLSSNSLAYIYRYPSDAPAGYGDLEVAASVINIFENGDVRKDILGYQNGGQDLRNMKKYPDTATGTDNIPLFRYEEVILNYAEALFEINNADVNAVTQLNLITSKRGATAITTATKDIILLERRKELMFEGFRFDDLMRTGKSIDVLDSNGSKTITITYPNSLFAYPIHVDEINANSNIEQNKGY